MLCSLAWTAKIRLPALRKTKTVGPYADESSVPRSLVYVQVFTYNHTMCMQATKTTTTKIQTHSVHQSYTSAPAKIGRRGSNKCEFANDLLRCDVARDSWHLAQNVINYGITLSSLCRNVASVKKMS